jgi:hypothetical protein
MWDLRNPESERRTKALVMNFCTKCWKCCDVTELKDWHPDTARAASSNLVCKWRWQLLLLVLPAHCASRESYCIIFKLVPFEVSAVHPCRVWNNNWNYILTILFPFLFTWAFPVILYCTLLYLCCGSCVPFTYGFLLLCLFAFSSFFFCPLPPSSPSQPLFTTFLLFSSSPLLILLLRCSGSELCVHSINFKRNVRVVMFAVSGKSKSKFTIEWLQTHTVTGNMLHMWKDSGSMPVK